MTVGEITQSKAEEAATDSLASDKCRIENLISDLTDRVQELEASRKLGKDVILDTQAYVNDMKNDLNALRKTRFWSVIFSLAYVIIVNILLGILIWFHKEYFKSLGSYTQAVLVIVTVSSTMTVLIAILKGCFKTYSERHKDDYIPPHLRAVKNVLDMVQDSAVKK